MNAKRKPVDLSRDWSFVHLQPEDDTVDVVQLRNGTWFPQQLTVAGRYQRGPLLTMSIAVSDGHPILLNLRVGMEDGSDGPLRPSSIHEIPLGQLLDETIARMAEVTLLFHGSVSEGGAPPRFPSVAAAKKAGRSAVVSQRGRPVANDTLRRVAEIVKANSYSPRVQIRKEFDVSLRTASRWIEEAGKHDFEQKEA